MYRIDFFSQEIRVAQSTALQRGRLLTLRGYSPPLFTTGVVEKFGASVRLIYWRPYGCLLLFLRFSVDINVLLRKAGIN